MEASADYPAVKRGEGWAACRLEELGDGPGFLKVRRALDVSAFGVNAIVLPPGIDTGFHYHDSQEELYFALRGSGVLRIDGDEVELEPGRYVLVEPEATRQVVAGPDGLWYAVVGAVPEGGA